MEVDLEANTAKADDAAAQEAEKVVEEPEKVPPPPRLVTVKVNKSEQSTAIGLGLVDKFGWCMINSVKPDGLCKDYTEQIKPGSMCVYSINGEPVKGGLDAALGMLHVAPVGELTIVAGPLGLVEAQVTKPSVEAKVGLHMIQKHGHAGEIVLGPVSGLFAETGDLKEGMTILQVNGVDCENKSVDDVLEMIAKTEGVVTVLAYDKGRASTGGDPNEASGHHRPPPGVSSEGGSGEWGSTSRLGPITWGLAIAGILCFGIGWIFILLFLPCDRSDVYAKDGKLYKPNGEFCKSQSDRNFEIRKSEHAPTKPPLSDHDKKGSSRGGRWGTTSYLGPLTWSVAIVALPTIIGAPLILLFLPMDQRDVYFCNGKLYLPNGDFCKTASERNFFINQSKHV